MRSMVLPTLALWEADYKCWEPGHTGKVGCSWDVGQGRFANEDYRAVRDWGFRFVLIAANFYWYNVTCVNTYAVWVCNSHGLITVNLSTAVNP